MGVVSGLIDLVVVAFSAMLAVALPLFNAQTVVAGLHPAAAVEMKRQYEVDFGDFLMADKPGFFVGLVWVDIVFIWPLSLANIYGILKRRRWASTTCLLAGASMGTSMAAIIGELLVSGRGSDKLLQMYVPFVVFSFFAILRGLLPRSGRTSTTSSHATHARKKRV